MVSRRRFLQTATAATVAGSSTSYGRQEEAASTVPSAPRLKLAMVTTVWRYLSHAQHMGDRFLIGYPHEGQWRRSPATIAGLYVDQIGDDDQSRARADEFRFEIFPTIQETLRLGGKSLAVDGVLLIGEHGDYPRNAKGQIQYPRYPFFQKITEVFRADGRSVPVFNDKHLSFRFDQAKSMVDDARSLGFPLMAGSSLPVGFRLPSIELPYGRRVKEALMVGVGSSDAMDFHALEAVQCLVERRHGGESGVEAVQLIDGDAVWEAGRRGEWSMELLQAALSRSNQLQGLSRTEAKPQDLIANGQLRELAKEPAMYRIWYRDGLQVTLLMLNGALADFPCAVRLEEPNEVLSTLFYLPPTPNVTYSAELMHRVESMFTSKEAQTPVERTLLVSGMLESCLDSRVAGGKKRLTPQLGVEYDCGEASTFAQS